MAKPIASAPNTHSPDTPSDEAPLAETIITFDDMHDIITPEPIAWYPLAPGWIPIILLFLFLTSLATRKAYQNWQQNTFKRQALKALSSCPPEQLPSLIKRTSLSAFPRHQVASLSGQKWINFINQKKDYLSPNQAELLLTISYQPNLNKLHDSPDYQQLTSSISRWIRSL